MLETARGAGESRWQPMSRERANMSRQEKQVLSLIGICMGSLGFQKLYFF